MKILNWWKALMRLNGRNSRQAHGSVSITDMNAAMTFYEKLGFKKVTSSRGDEVVLLRNTMGDELNLVQRSGERSAGHVSFRVSDIELIKTQIASSQLAFELLEGAAARELRLLDPDGNTVTFCQLLSGKEKSHKQLFHVATRAELLQGLDDHYYLPPEGERRFVHAPARSSFVAMACEQVAKEVGDSPLVIEMDQARVSIEEEWSGEDLDSRQPIATFPHVYSPVMREAILAVGECDEAYNWPGSFRSLASTESANPLPPVSR